MCTFDDAGDRDSENHRQFRSQPDSKLAKWKPWVRRRFNKFRWEKKPVTCIFSTKTLFFMTLQKKHNAFADLSFFLLPVFLSLSFEKSNKNKMLPFFELFEPQACRTQRLKAGCRISFFPCSKCPFKANLMTIFWKLSGLSDNSFSWTSRNWHAMGRIRAAFGPHSGRMAPF